MSLNDFPIKGRAEKLFKKKNCWLEVTVIRVDNIDAHWADFDEYRRFGIQWFIGHTPLEVNRKEEFAPFLEFLSKFGTPLRWRCSGRRKIGDGLSLIGMWKADLHLCIHAIRLLTVSPSRLKEVVDVAGSPKEFRAFAQLVK